MRGDFDAPRRRSVLPTLAAVAAGGLLCVAPASVDDRVRMTMRDLAGPVLAALPSVRAEPAPGDDAPAVAALAREVARLRAILAARDGGDAEDRLVTPAWLTVRTLGAAADRGRVRELLIAAEGEAAAAADAAALAGDLPAVDAGADRQVRAGDLAVRGGVVCGRVASVGRHVAAVRPVTDDAFRLAVTVAGAPGVLAGGAAPAVRFLPAAAAVRAGAAVTCDPAEAGGAALPVAVVTNAEKTPAGEWAVTVRPLATLDAAGETVRIVRAGLNRRRVPAGVAE